MARTIAVSNHKGGVGKTVTTKNIGIALARWSAPNLWSSMKVSILHQSTLDHHAHRGTIICGAGGLPPNELCGLIVL
jgi:hypothetical protein